MGQIESRSFGVKPEIDLASKNMLFHSARVTWGKAWLKDVEKCSKAVGCSGISPGLDGLSFRYQYD